MKKDRKGVWGLINIYNVIVLLLGVGFYFLIPAVLNYGPETINSYFETQIDAGATYYKQFIAIVLVIMALVDVFVWWQIKGFNKLGVLLGKDDEKSKVELEKLKKRCFQIPYVLYLCQLFVVPVIIALVLYLTKTEGSLIIKISALAFVFMALLSVTTYVFTKKLMRKLLIRMDNLEVKRNFLKFDLKSKIFLQIIPLFLVTAVFLALVGYAGLVHEKGNMQFDEYRIRLANLVSEDVDSEEDVIKAISSIDKISEEDKVFVIKNGEEVFSEGEQLSEFLLKYALLVGEKYDGHLYDYYASDRQATAEYFKIGNDEYIVGIYYDLASESMVFLFFGSIFLMLIIAVFILYYFAEDMSSDIKEIAGNLTNISEQVEIDYDKKLVVTSNDEIGDLVVAFNKILDLEKNNIEKIERNQEILVEQERLSSLGQLIGGIAHNLKTPIMSISGALEGVTDLVNEYDESIDDSTVTKEDHHQIAKEMNDWIEKIRPYLSYMTEVIDAVKGQAVSMNASTYGKFSAEELIVRTQILMKNELKRRHCKLNLDLKIEKDSYIKGEISAIVQVMDNLIINAMDAYHEGGEIDIRVREDETKVFIEVQDYAGGIAPHVKDKLFKEMVTSKGKNGTGLGLYMCYSTIKGKFNGDMRFESEEGKGTTFFIELNKITEEEEKKD